jgi:hypothetical protein
MSKRKNTTDESGSFPFAVAAIAICALVLGATDALAPAAATSGASSTTAYDGSVGYFPAQFVNQAKEIEPMPEMYY